MKPATVAGYIAGFPKPVQTLLRKVRATIRAAAPQTTEVISYGIPAYKGHGMVVFFAGFKGHIGLFPPVRGNAALEKAVKRYANPKGNLRFSYDEPVPFALISRIVRFQVKRDRERAAAKAAKQKRGLTRRVSSIG